MIGNFRLANKFVSVYSKYTHENVFFDRFNSVFKGFYLLVNEQHLAEMIKNNSPITFWKIPSTERFGSQDVTWLEYRDPNLLTQEDHNMIRILNSVIDTGYYNTADI